MSEETADLVRDFKGRCHVEELLGWTPTTVGYIGGQTEWAEHESYPCQFGEGPGPARDPFLIHRRAECDDLASWLQSRGYLPAMRYEYGEWRIILHSATGVTVPGGPHRSIRDALIAAVRMVS